jgi:hypothetical protein
MGERCEMLEMRGRDSFAAALYPFRTIAINTVERTKLIVLLGDIP